MPELPEVEVISKELDVTVQKNSNITTISGFMISRFSLRKKLSLKQLEPLKGHRLIKVFRRAKYLIFETTGGYLLNHLGMTGSWRIESKGFESKKHDHFVIYLSNDVSLVYNDPRRFGLVDVADEIGKFTQLKKLGPEPLSLEFKVDLFFKDLKRKKQNIKQVLMNPEVVVGVGNIYASEILFRSKVKPTRPAYRIKKEEADKIFLEIKKVLQESIEHGGSTLRDYRRLEGDAGGFQDRHLVYGRKGKTCVHCQSKISSKFLGGRSTFWCPRCQI